MTVKERVGSNWKEVIIMGTIKTNNDQVDQTIRGEWEK
jgi:hypothetical protein